VVDIVLPDTSDGPTGGGRRQEISTGGTVAGDEPAEATE
jgi:hypothetical protein